MEKNLYDSDLGDEWSPMILNSQEEMNITIVTNPDPVIRQCRRQRVVIGGRTNNSLLWSYFHDPHFYIPNNGGNHMFI